MEKQKKSFGTIALVVLLLVVTVVSLVLATYAWAKYSSVRSGTSSANVAAWDVTLDSTTKNFAGTYSHVVTGEIAPGTSGSFDVEINPGNTQVCIAYQISLKNAQYEGSNGTVANIKHLKFFSDAAHTKEVKIDGTVNPDLTGTIDLSTSATATTPATTHNDSHNGTVKETIYWVWPYDYAEASAMKQSGGETAVYTAEELGANAEEYDAEDTKVGQNITAMTVTYDIRAWQVDPGDSNGNVSTDTTNVPANN